MEKLLQKAQKRLSEKSGASLIWAVFILIAAVMTLAAVLLISTTYSMASEVKNEVGAAGESVLQNDYLGSSKGFGSPSLSVSDIETFLENNNGMQKSGNTEKKLISDGNVILCIEDISVTRVENQGGKAENLHGYEISYTFSRPIRFGSATVFSVYIPMKNYVWYTPTDF